MCKTIASKIAKVMATVTRVAKSQTNQHHHYRYASADDIYDMVREAMAENNLALIPLAILDVQTQQSGNATYYTVKFKFLLVSGDTDDQMEIEWVGQAMDTQDKGISKAQTQATKYLLRGLFLISTGDQSDDPDAGPAPSQPARQTTQSSRQSGRGQPQSSQTKTSKNEARQKGWQAFLDGYFKEPAIRDHFKNNLPAFGQAVAKWLGVEGLLEYTKTYNDARQIVDKELTALGLKNAPESAEDTQDTDLAESTPDDETPQTSVQARLQELAATYQEGAGKSSLSSPTELPTLLNRVVRLAGMRTIDAERQKALEHLFGTDVKNVSALTPAQAFGLKQLITQHEHEVIADLKAKFVEKVA